MTKAIANREKLKTFGDLLEKRKASFAQVLPQHVRVDRLIRAALLSISRQPLLLQCTQNSIIQSMMIASQLGLEPDGVLGSAHLVPFRNKAGEYEAQLIPGYRGLIDLARRSGQIKRIEARIVCKNDKFEMSYGLNPTLNHIPSFPEEGGEIIGAYAIAELAGGEIQFDFMNKFQIDGIKARSKAKDSGPWVSDYAEMARKTVVRRLIKYLPLSVELARAIEVDNRVESGDSMNDMIDIEAEELPAEMLPEPKKTRTQEIKEQIAPPESPESPQITDLSTVKGSIMDAQIDQIEGLCHAKGVIATAALPDGVASVMDLSQAQADEIINRIGEL